METFDSGGDNSLLETPSAESTVFDASQYAFFGGTHVVDEVELGGFEEDEDDDTAAALTLSHVEEEEEDYMLHKNEGGFLRSLSPLNGLASNINKVELTDLREKGISVDRVASSKNSYVPQWKQDDSNDWSAQHIFDSERTVDGKVWSPELFSSYSHPAESQSLQRTSSYPQQPPLQLESISGDPHVVPGSSFTSYPPISRELYLLNKPYRPETVTLPPPNTSSSNQFPGSEANLASRFNVNPLSLAPHAQKVSNQWENQAGSFPSGNASLLSSSLQQSVSRNEAMNQFFVHQQHNLHQIRPSHGHLMGRQILSQNSHAHSTPNMLSKFDPMLLLADWGDHHYKMGHLGRQSTHNYSQRSYESVGQVKESWWPSHRSKCMTADELDNILRLQLAATHSNDPYVDDYYHQASLAKKADGARLKRHFCPANLRDIRPGARANTEAHAFLQVEALGRIPFSSIRRPRPLLEIDSPSSASLIRSEAKGVEKPLELEPLLAARLAIENGMDMLLEVDDIDRFLQFNQLQDGGAHLKWKRQNLLKEVAVSLHLVGTHSKKNQTARLTSEDELVFLRLVSLPKGRKFLACYIQHLLPGDDELIRMVIMAILCHLRFLFDCTPKDSRAAETTANLARVVASSVTGLDLGALSACLDAVVYSSEQPSFRPIGSLAGDGASVILTSILQRATVLLTDPRASETYNVSDRALWQISFDEFFGILTAYCMKKYDSIMQTRLVRNTTGSAFLLPDAAGAISKEMPVELLRASLPHTNELQRKVLLDFAQRAMPVTEKVDEKYGPS